MNCLRVKSELGRDLPKEYMLQAERPEPDKEVNFAPDFLITLSPERNVQLRGTQQKSPKIWFKAWLRPALVRTTCIFPFG